MRMRSTLIAILMLCTGPAAVAAQQSQRDQPAALSRLLDCRAIASAEERLACFDREAGAMDVAVKREDLVVMDRQQIRKTRSSLFGFALPDLGIFGDKDEDAAIAKVESTVRSVNSGPDGKWVITLADGARWLQIDSRDLPIEPRPGHKIVIRRAALGSYLANVYGQTARRVRRIN